MKTIVYTANIGNYDHIDMPAFRSLNPDVEFILFTTDLKYKSDDWTVKYVVDPKLINEDNQRVARYFKLQPHKVLPPHDVSIWFDSCLSLKIKSYKKFLKENLIDRDLEMVSYKHPLRNCSYVEATVCMSMGLDNGIRIKRHMESYRKQRFPKNFGLFDTGLVVRVNTPKMVEFNDLWYTELKAKSKRDQLSHPYAVWKTGIRIASFLKGSKKGASPYLKKRKHRTGRIRIGGALQTSKPKRTEAQDALNRKLAFKRRMRR